MNSLRQIFEQAQRNNATKGLSWKEYKNAMKQAGITNRQLFLKNPEARKKANELFYGTPEVTVPSIFSLGQVKNFTPKPIKPEPEDIVEEEEIIVEPPKTIKEQNSTNQNTISSTKQNTNPLQSSSKITTLGLIQKGLKRNPWYKPDGISLFGLWGKQIHSNTEQRIKTFIKDNYGIDIGKQTLKQFLGDDEYNKLYDYIDDNIIPEQQNNKKATIANATTEVMNNKFKQGGKMTQKFQQGGQTSSQDVVMQFVQALAQTLQADPNQVIQAAQQNPEALKSAVQVYQQTQDMQQAAQAFTQALQSQAQAAKHGAKLNYLKALKNQCAEDEELVYFKKGGKVDCGCVKKSQEGGKAPKKESPVMKFKKTIKSKDQAMKDSAKLDPKTTKTLPNGKYPSNWTADDKIIWEREHGPKDEGSHTAREQKCGGKMKKDCGGSKLKLKKGDKVCPKCGKVHSAGMGCAVNSFKNRKK